MQQINSNALRGLYQDDIKNDITDKCFNEAGIEKLQKAITLIQKIKVGDIFTITMAEHEAAVMDIIELFWQTMDDCKFHIPVQDLIHWCRDNTDKCVHKKHLVERL